jgi:hypothetical protein
MVVLKLPEARLTQIDMNNKKHLFVLQYLNIHHNGLLDKQELSFEELNIEVHSLPEHQIHLLLDEYFFKPMRDAEPSFIHLQAFLEVLFESFNIFSKSPYYSVAFMQ